MSAAGDVCCGGDLGEHVAQRSLAVARRDDRRDTGIDVTLVAQRRPSGAAGAR